MRFAGTFLSFAPSCNWSRFAREQKAPRKTSVISFVYYIICRGLERVLSIINRNLLCYDRRRRIERSVKLQAKLTVIQPVRRGTIDGNVRAFEAFCFGRTRSLNLRRRDVNCLERGILFTFVLFPPFSFSSPPDRLSRGGRETRSV